MRKLLRIEGKYNRKPNVEKIKKRGIKTKL